MVSGSNYIDSRFEKTLSCIRCNSQASGGILTVCYYYVCSCFLEQGLQAEENGSAACLTDDIPENKYSYRVDFVLLFLPNRRQVHTLAGVLNNPGFPNDGYLDSSRILQLGFYFLDDVLMITSQLGGMVK